MSDGLGWVHGGLYAICAAILGVVLKLWHKFHKFVVRINGNKITVEKEK